MVLMFWDTVNVAICISSDNADDVADDEKGIAIAVAKAAVSMFAQTFMLIDWLFENGYYWAAYPISASATVVSSFVAILMVRLAFLPVWLLFDRIRQWYSALRDAEGVGEDVEKGVSNGDGGGGGNAGEKQRPDCGRKGGETAMIMPLWATLGGSLRWSKELGC